MKQTNVCIRVNRDESQIHRAQGFVRQVDGLVDTFVRSLKLIANPVRLKILLLLHRETRLCVCDLSEILGMTVPAVSQHLKKLYQGELVDKIQEGVTVFYHLRPSAKPLLYTLFGQISKKEPIDLF